MSFFQNTLITNISCFSSISYRKDLVVLNTFYLDNTDIQFFFDLHQLSRTCPYPKHLRLPKLSASISNENLFLKQKPFHLKRKHPLSQTKASHLKNLSISTHLSILTTLSLYILTINSSYLKFLSMFQLLSIYIYIYI